MADSQNCAPSPDAVASWLAAADYLLAAPDAYMRLAGKVALLQPYHRQPSASPFKRRYKEASTWTPNPTLPEAANRTMSRSLSVGKKVSEVIFEARFSGQFEGKHIDLRLLHDPSRTARFYQPLDIIDYLDPLPMPADEVRAVNSFLSDVADQRLVITDSSIRL